VAAANQKQKLGKQKAEMGLRRQGAATWAKTHQRRSAETPLRLLTRLEIPVANRDARQSRRALAGETDRFP
jgi:hypothetical protein